jgi:hypothetical protein
MKGVNFEACLYMFKVIVNLQRTQVNWSALTTVHVTGIWVTALQTLEGCLGVRVNVRLCGDQRCNSTITCHTGPSVWIKPNSFTTPESSSAQCASGVPSKNRWRVTTENSCSLSATRRHSKLLLKSSNCNFRRRIWLSGCIQLVLTTCPFLNNGKIKIRSKRVSLQAFLSLHIPGGHKLQRAIVPLCHWLRLWLQTGQIPNPQELHVLRSDLVCRS